MAYVYSVLVPVYYRRAPASVPLSHISVYCHFPRHKNIFSSKYKKSIGFMWLFLSWNLFLFQVKKH
jgi:hypothetical protein